MAWEMPSALGASIRPLTSKTSTGAVVPVPAVWAPAALPAAPSAVTTPSTPRAIANLRTDWPPKGERGPAGVLRRRPAARRGREGRRGQDHGNGRPRLFGSQGRSPCPRGGGRGQEWAGRPPGRPGRAGLRGGHLRLRSRTG